MNGTGEISPLVAEHAAKNTTKAVNTDAALKAHALFLPYKKHKTHATADATENTVQQEPNIIFNVV